MKRTLGLGLSLLWICLYVAGCGESGQTGSPACAQPSSCVCASLSGRVVVAATVLEASKARTKLRVDEIFVQTGLTALAEGDTLAGDNEQRYEACGRRTSSVPAVGAKVLAAYLPPRDCGDAAVCDRKAGGTISTLALTDPVRLGDDTEVPLAEIGALYYGELCEERYPAEDDDRPCNDEVDNACSATPARLGTPFAAWFGAALVGALALRRRRNRR